MCTESKMINLKAIIAKEKEKRIGTGCHKSLNASSRIFFATEPETISENFYLQAQSEQNT